MLVVICISFDTFFVIELYIDVLSWLLLDLWESRPYCECYFSVIILASITWSQNDSKGIPNGNQMGVKRRPK